MYVVLITNKSREPFSDIIPELKKEFPEEVFTIYGSEEKGYQLRIEGIGDEKAPRAYAIKYMKTWKPKPLPPDGCNFYPDPIITEKK
jgi:hypothetical protein